MSDDNPRKIIEEHFQKGDYTGWFDKVYASGNVPWAIGKAHPLLTQWMAQHEISGAGKRALVVGCGLGDDAEFLAQRAYNVTAFDISETAIAACQTRFPDTQVDYQVADLLNAPEAWGNAFDFVFESRTIQALPWHMSEDAMRAISHCVKVGGTLVVVCFGRDPEDDRRGIPWRLSHEDLAHFAHWGLQEKQFEDVQGNTRNFRVTYQKIKATN